MKNSDSTKQYVKGEQTRQHILDVAKAEFLEKGYLGVSIRNIAKIAEVTTGAVFRYFPDKESLFGALVDSVADTVLSMYSKGNQQGYQLLEGGEPQKMWQISDQFIHNFVEYLFANKEAFSLLINCSGGSPYESFIDNLVAEVERQTYAFLQEMLKKEYPCKKLSSVEIHVLISAQYHAIFEIVRHDLSKEDAISRLRLIGEFFRPGWNSIFGGK